MSGKFFWLMTMLTFALIGHLSYTLFAPKYQVQSAFENAFGAAPETKFFILTSQQSKQLFPAEDPNLVLAVCPFNVSTNSAKISIAAFSNYWSLSIYANTGDSFYTINDRQARFSNLSVIIKTNAQESEQGSDDEKSERETALKLEQAIIKAPTQKGWVVLRMLGPNALSHKSVVDAARKFSCKTIDGVKS